MKKSRQISLKDCYEVLQLQKNASLEDVKKSYRRRAFELHPDLNPDNPEAGKQFQLLNEAYVALSNILQKEENKSNTRAKGAQTTAGTKTSYDAAAREKYKQQRAYDPKEGARREAEARKRQEELRQEKLRQEKLRQERQQQEKLRQEKLQQEKLRQQKIQQEAEARRKMAEEAAEAARQRVEEAEKAAEESARKNQESVKDEQRQRAANEAYGKEGVLHEILNDSFARRVFEDIYSEVNKQNSEKEARKKEAETEEDAKTSSDAQAHTNANANTAKPETPPEQPPIAQVELGDSKPSTHTANSFSDKIKGWFKHQIDDEQTIKMPASHLFAGSRIRLQIRRGLSEELTTVEIVLPTDFVVGKPLRLRGLGKKVGKWQGDLYLTIERK